MTNHPKSRLGKEIREADGKIAAAGSTTLEEELRRRDRILRAINVIAERCLRAGSLDALVADGLLSELGHATGVCRVYIFENHLNPAGEPVTSQRYEWVAAGISPQVRNPDLQCLAWRHAPWWQAEMQAKRIVRGNVKTFPVPERKILAAQNICSILALPVYVEEHWWGFIGFDACIEERAWSEAEMDALGMAGGILGAFLKRKQVEDELTRYRDHLEDLVQERTAELLSLTETLRKEITERTEMEKALGRQNEYLAALHETSLNLMRRLELNDLLQALVTRATELVGVPEGFVYLLDPVTGELEIRAATGGLADRVGTRFEVGEGTAGTVWQTGKSLRIDNYQTWPQRSPKAYYHRRQSTVATPLKSGENLVGVIGLSHYDPDKKLDADDVAILEHFAELASIALDNALLYARMQAELSERQRLEAERNRMESHLRQSQKMKAIETLAGGIAHDFNNLLMGIQGNATLMLLANDPAHPEYARLKAIERNVQRGAELTKQLLGFAQGGKYEVQVTDLNRLLREGSEGIGRTKKEIALHLDLGNDLWRVDVDRDQIKQVQLNLFLNAWQAMPGGGELRIRTTNVVLADAFVKPHGLAPGKYVKATFTDTGVGIEPPVLERVFEPFFTTREMGRGTGLGLASAYGIIKNHGGIIQAESRKDQGSTFTFYLPASAREEAKMTVTEQPIPQGSGRILLVDDEQLILDVVTPMLQRLGYQVLTASGGLEALEIYRQHPDQVNLIVLDLIMPDIGGGETFDRLRRINPQAKVLLSSGYSIEGLATEIMDRGCDGFLQKPFTLNSLYQKITEILQKDPDPQRL